MCGNAREKRRGDGTKVRVSFGSAWPDDLCLISERGRKSRESETFRWPLLRLKGALTGAVRGATSWPSFLVQFNRIAANGRVDLHALVEVRQPAADH